MSLGMASLGKTEAFLYTMLPTSLGVALTALSGTTDVFIGITILALTSSIGSMILYTTRPDEFILLRVYRNYLTGKIKELDEAFLNWLLFFKMWKSPAVLSFISESWLKPEINQVYLKSVIQSTISSRIFLQRLWRIRVAFFAGLSVGSLIASAVGYLSPIMGDIDFWIPFALISIVYVSSLIPYWIIRRMQRQAITEFTICLSQYFVLVMVFSMFKISGDDSDLPVETNNFSDQLNSLNDVLKQEDWAQYDIRWASFRNTLISLLRESLVEDWLWDFLQEWCNLIVAYSTAKGVIIALNRFNAYLMLSKIATTQFTDEFGLFEKRVLEVVNSASTPDGLSRESSEELIERIVETEYSKANTDGQADIFMWLSDIESHSPAARVGLGVDIRNQSKQPLIRPSRLNMSGRTRTRYEKFLMR